MLNCVYNYSIWGCGMLQQLFNNLVLIIAFIFASVFLIKRAPGSLSVIHRLGIGLLQGCFGIILMFQSVSFNNTTILDLRQLSIMMAAYFGGLYASLTAALIIISFRLSYFGVTASSITASIIALTLGLATGLFSCKIRHFWTKWIVMLACGIILLSSGLYFLLGNKSMQALMHLLPFFLTGGIIIVCTIQVVSHLKKQNELHKAVLELTYKFRTADIYEIYEYSAIKIANLLGVEYVSIVLLENNKFRVVSLLEKGIYTVPNKEIEESDIAAIASIKKGHSSIYSNWNKRRPNGTLELGLFQKGIRSTIYIPVIYKETALAMITIGSKQANYFTHNHIDEISQLTPLISFSFGLKDAEHKFISVSQSTADAIILTDHKLLITSWNEGATKIFGYQADEIIGKHIEFILSIPSREAYKSSIERYGSGSGKSPSGTTIELEGMKVKGSVFPIELSLNSWTIGGLTFYSSIIRDISQRKEIEMKLRHANETLMKLSTIDGLTGISNRRSFEDMFGRKWKDAVRHSRPIALVLCDIDFFKSYNDTYGHQGGDQCLKEVSKALEKSLMRPGDFVARYGGEEFVILLPNTDAEGASHIAESIRIAVSSLEIPHIQSSVSEYVSLSLGVASIVPSPYLDPKDLIESADKALYRAKLNGRNRVEISTEVRSLK